MFASCDNPSDTNPANNSGNNTSLGNNNNNSNSNNDNSDSSDNDNDNSSSTLPGNVGKNPIKKTIKLNRDGYTSDECYLELKADGTARYIRIHSGEEEIEAQFTYTYDANKKEIYMKYENMYNAQTTFAYEIEDGEITLTEKFTGVKNMFKESACICYYNRELLYGIYSEYAFYYEDDVEYTGIPNTDKKTISFRSEEGLKLNATYTENIKNETVTINCEGEKYVCEFEGQIFTQE